MVELLGVVKHGRQTATPRRDDVALGAELGPEGGDLFGSVGVDTSDPTHFQGGHGVSSRSFSPTRLRFPLPGNWSRGNVPATSNGGASWLHGRGEDIPARSRTPTTMEQPRL